MASEARFAQLLSRVGRMVTLRQASDVCCGDLTLEQFQTLQAISGSAQPSIGGLSSRSRVDLSTMSRNVTVLERGGYLVRARAAEDGRVVRVRLTPKGKRALASLKCEEQDVFGDVYRRLPATQRPRILEALETLQAGLQASDTLVPVCCPPAKLRKRAP